MNAMISFKVSRFASIVLLLCALFALALGGSAAEPRVTGRLSTTTASVGESVQYALTVTAPLPSDEAAFPNVDGLDVRGVSHSTSFSFRNGATSRETTITYVLVPRRVGTFTIPPIEVNIGGRKLATKPVTLTVAGGGKPAVGAGDIAFAEIRLGKKTAYIGEAIPIDIRLYFDNNMRWQFPEKPILSGKGFTTQQVEQIRGSEQRMELAGKEYAAITLRTVITPSQAGKISVGPFPLNAVVSKRRRNMYGIPFDGPMVNAQNVEVIAPAVELEVKLLPTKDQPPEFAGAIGKFKFEGVGTPNRVNVGEPVQMVLTVSGEGNFDRIRTPPIGKPDGWRIYDAEEKFEATDSFGVTGTKTFSVPVAPTTKQTKLPVFVFAYFDPESGTYHMLRSVDADLTVTGAEAAPPSVTTAPEVANADAPTPSPSNVQAQDILSILPNAGPAWIPGAAYSSRLLIGLLVAPLPILAGLLFWRSRRTDPRANIIRQLRREKSQLYDRVKHSTDRAEVYDAATRLLQVEAALISNKMANACELPDVLAARRLTPVGAQAVEALFNERANLVYAGGVRDSELVRSTERDRILDTLTVYERSQVQ